MTSVQIDIRDGLSSSVAIKGPVKCATTGNITLNGEQTIDGVAVVTGDRVLVKSQTTASDNGIWICDTGNWRRSKDFNKTRDVKTGTLVVATGGTVGPGVWQLTTADPISVGTTSIVFSQAVQPFDSDLAAIAALTTTAYGRSLLTSTNLSSIIGTGAITSGMIADGVVSNADIFDPGATPANGISAAKLFYLNAGTSAVAQLISAKLDTIVELEDFGGVGDDATDNVTAFTRANTYLNANGGGCIKLRRGGKYRIASAITLSAKVSVIADHYSSEIKTTSATANMLVLGGNCIVRGVTFTTSITRTAGDAININAVGQVLVYENLFVDVFDGISTYGACSLIWIRDNSIYKNANASSVGIRIGVSGSAGNDFFIRDNFIRGAASGTQGYGGIILLNSGGTYMSGNSVLWCGAGISLEPSTGQSLSWTFSSQDTADTCSIQCVRLNPNAAVNIKGTFFDGLWCSTGTAEGFIINPGTGNIDGVDINNPRCFNNGKEGIKINGGSFININGGMICGNSGASSGTYSGIFIAAGVSDFGIANVLSGPGNGFGASQKYGIEIAAGASDSYVVTGNRCRANLTGGILDGGTGTAKQVYGNTPDLGYKGTNTNNNSATGFIGEYVESVIASGSAVALTTATAKDVTTISLTAGDWDVEFISEFTGGATTTVNYLVGSVSSGATNTLDQTNGRFVAHNFGAATLFNAVPSALFGFAGITARFSLSATTTIRAVAQASFGTSTCSAYGVLRARRVR